MILRALKTYIINAKWRSLVAPFKRKIAEAQKRGNTRAIGHARGELRQFTSTALGWRGKR